MSIPQSQVIIADPYDGATTFKNADDLNGKVFIEKKFDDIIFPSVVDVP
jgi:hypothetical protein